MDSWFVNDYMIKSIRSINNSAMHVLGMCKIDNRKYTYNNKELNAHQLITKLERKKLKYSRKFKSHYFTVVVNYKGMIHAYIHEIGFLMGVNKQNTGKYSSIAHGLNRLL
jgi:hypothetical protein